MWIDTCCIDKKSSAELSEAINSMYRWYEDARECYVHLSDVSWDLQNEEESRKSFIRSLWFTRGWTLQELIAPSHVEFFDRDWKSIGTKGSLLAEISATTGINKFDLEAWTGACIATKMSWMSRRKTSRIEDMAYCMLGLFDVNMPLLYGEGRKSFMRLQLEILKKSDDESIFAWTTTASMHLGMLATSPRYFAQSGDIFVHPDLRKKRLPYAMTNQGLEFQVPCRRDKIQSSVENLDPTDDQISIALNCWRKVPKGPVAVTIMLGRFGDTWKRVNCHELHCSEPVEDLISDAIMDGSGLETRRNTALIYISQQGM